MGTVRHGGLALDIPKDWEDRSTLLFVSPAENPSLPTAKPVERSREAVTVDFGLGEGRAPQTVLAQRAEALRKVDPSFELIKEGPFSCGLGEGWCYEQRLTMGEVQVRQLAVVCVIGPIEVRATAAASEGRIEFVREKLAGVLSSLRPAERG